MKHAILIAALTLSGCVTAQATKMSDASPVARPAKAAQPLPTPLPSTHPLADMSIIFSRGVVFKEDALFACSYMHKDRTIFCMPYLEFMTRMEDLLQKK